MRLPVVVLFSFLSVLSSARAADLAAAIAMVEEGRYAEADRELQKLRSAAATRAAATQWLGRSALLQNDVDRATALLEEAVRLAPVDADAHFWLGRTYGAAAMSAGKLAQVRLASKVRASFEEAVRLKTDHVDARIRLFEFYLIAPGFMGGGVDKAKREADQILRHDPLRGRRARGVLARRAKDFAAEEREYLAARKAAPADAAPAQWLGFFYQEQKQWMKAFAAFEDALRLKPGDRSAMYQIGRTAVFSGTNLDRGIAALQQYLKSPHVAGQPSHAHAHWRMGELLEKKGDVPAARREYTAALKLDAKLEDARKALARLGS